jgi:hypothetical protein
MNKIFLAILIISCYWVILVNGTRPAECELGSKVGHCRALIPKYYFNSLTNKCEQFYYGGCNGMCQCFDR